MVNEGQDRVPVEQQPLALAGVGHIGELMGRNVELLCKNLPVASRLIEHIDEIAVFKDVLHLAGGKQVFDILSDAGGDAAPFAIAFPNLHAVRSRLFLLQQKVELIEIVARGFMGGAVDGHAVPDLILYHQHPDFLELLAKLLDVVADDAAVHIHIGVVVEHIQRTGDIDFKGGGNVLRFLFVLCAEGVIQVLQHRHILRFRVVEIVPVDDAHTTVNDGFLHRRKPVLTAHDQLAQRQDKVGFQAQRVIIIAVIQIQVHRIDIAGRTVVALAGGRQLNDLTVQTLHQRCIFALRVTDDDVILGADEKRIGDLTFCRKRLAAAGSA